MSTLVIRGLRAACGGPRSSTASTWSVSSRRGPRRDGPQRLGQVHAVRRRDGQARATRCSAARSPSTVTTSSRWRPGSGPWPASTWPCSTRPRCPACASTPSCAEGLGPGAGHPGLVADAARRGRPHRLRRALPRTAAQRRPVRRREEAQRDAAARGARAAHRHPRRARLRSRRRRAARGAPAGSRRRPTRTTSACSPSPTTTACSTS